MRFKIILEEEKDGGYSVYVPALDGCQTQGDTRGEALKNAREAIECYLESLAKEGIPLKKIPKIDIATVSV